MLHRTFHKVALLLLLATAPFAAMAQERIARIVVPVPAGGNFDLIARPLATRLTAATGDKWIVEHRPGAETMIGSELVARAPADGRTLLIGGATLTLVPQLRQTGIGPDDLRPVAAVVQSGYLLLVRAQSPIQTAADLVAAAASRDINCAAAPGPMGLGCAQLDRRLGGRVESIPFQGVSQAITSLLGGHVDILIAPSDIATRYVEAGSLRALASMPAMPALKVPEMTELWPGFVMENFAGVFAPQATPDAQVRRINAVVNAMLADPAFIAAMREAGQEPLAGTPEEFARRVARARSRYAQLIPTLAIPQK